MKIIKNSRNENVVAVTHQNEDVGLLYKHKARHNAHVLVFASALAENWVRGNPWLQEELRTRLRTDENPSGSYTTLSKEEERTVIEDLKERILRANMVSSDLLTNSTEYVTEALHEALAGEPHLVNAQVVELIRGYLTKYFI